MGCERFIRRTRKELSARAKGRVLLKSEETFHLREPGVFYLVDFDSKNDDIGAGNGYFWKNNYSPDIS